MTLEFLSGMYFFLVANFGLYAMYRNDDVVTNRWLFLCGWFMWGCMMCITINTFLTYAVIHGYITILQVNLFYKGFTAIAYSPMAALVFSVGFIFYSMYLFSLRKRCMEAEFLPRTFKIWLTKTWRRIFKRHIYHNPKNNTQYARVH